MSFLDGLFGDSPPGVKTKWTKGWRDEMERLAGEGENVFNDFMQFRQEMQDYSTNLMQNVVSTQLNAFQQQFQNSQELFDLAKSDRSYYEQYYKPVEEQMRKDAQNWDSPEEIQRAMGGATANVAAAFQAEKRNRQAQLEGFGIDLQMYATKALTGVLKSLKPQLKRLKLIRQLESEKIKLLLCVLAWLILVVALPIAVYKQQAPLPI